jgi:hypothetical protein
MSSSLLLSISLAANRRRAGQPQEVEEIKDEVDESIRGERRSSPEELRGPQAVSSVVDLPFYSSSEQGISSLS